MNLQTPETPFIHEFVYLKNTIQVIINDNCLLWTCKGKTQVISLNNILSVWSCSCKVATKDVLCDCLRKKVSTIQDSYQGQSKIHSFRLFYVCPCGKYEWKLKWIRLELIEKNGNANMRWHQNIQYFLNRFNRPKKVLVFINPIGGSKKGPKIFEKLIEPLFQVSGIIYSSIVTERANHARDIINNLDTNLSDIDGIISVGGDGMFNEILHGLIFRTQMKHEIDISSPSASLKHPIIPIGIIPAGSTDAVCCSVFGSSDPVTAAIHILLGNTIKLDVASVHDTQDEGRLMKYSSAFLGYGFFGDLVKKCDSMRWMGPQRYNWQGLKKFLKNEAYTGEIRLKVSTLDGSPKDKNICITDCPICAKSALRKKHHTNNEGMNEVDEEASMVQIKGRFMAINSSTIANRCRFTKKGISPSAHLGNGCTDLILVSRCSRFNFLKYLLRVGLMNKSIFDLNYIDVYRVKEFQFTPISSPDINSKKSVWNCDGEVILQPEIFVKMHCQVVSVFGSGVECRSDTVFK